MKLKKATFKKVKKLQAFTPVLVVGILMLTGAVIYNFNARAATAGFYFNSPATTYRVGDTFTVTVFENSTECANVVQADFTYPENLLRFNSVDKAASKFNTYAPNSPSGGSGSVSMVQYTSDKGCNGGATSGYSGDQFIGNVSFTVIGAGTATLNFKNSSIAVSSADNKTNVAPAQTSRTFTLTDVPVTPAPAPAPTPGPAPAPAPSPSGQSDPYVSSSNSGSDYVTSYTYTQGESDTSTPAGNNETVELGAPVDVNPLPIQPDGISRIDYILNGKVVSTVTKSPYLYHLDTTKLLNGKYTLTTKTYYMNGQMKSVSQTVVVKNPFSLTQLRLILQKMAWLIILVLLLAGAAVAAWIIHRRDHGGDDYFDDGTSYVTSDTTKATGDGGNIANEPTIEPTIVKPEGATPEPDDVIRPSSRPQKTSPSEGLQQQVHKPEPAATPSPTVVVPLSRSYEPRTFTPSQPRSAQPPVNDKP